MPYITQKEPNKKLVLAGIFGFIVLIVALITFSLSRFLIQEKITLKKPMVLLLIGVDTADFKKEVQPGSIRSIQSDTLILSFIDPEKHRISLVSIPKDTLVNIPGFSLDRISNAGVLGGDDLLKKAVTALTDIPIDRYAEINSQGLAELVDILGGIEINLPKTIMITDESGKNITTLAAGKVLLNGERAMQYVRLNNALPEDLSRLERQRNLLFALGRKLKEPKNIAKIPRLVELMKKYVKTDLTSQEVMQLLSFTQQIKTGKGFISNTLPGSLYEGYWQPAPLKMNNLLRRIKPKNPQTDGGIQVD